MSQKFLHRDDAPFDDKVWEAIDKVVVNSAKAQLSGRRMLHIEGPYGLGLKVLPCGDDAIDGKSSDDTELSACAVVPVVSVKSEFTLGMRDIAAFESSGVPLDMSAVSIAAAACARREDEIIFKGSKALNVEGLLNAKGSQSVKLQSWNEIGKAADDIIKAVTTLDSAGFHGPTILALAPNRYNLLYRRYQQGNMTEMDHISSIVTAGVIKAPALESGGVLLASGRQYASIAIGQDLMTGFVGPAGTSYEFYIAESLALRLLQPEAVCVLQ